MYGGTRFCVVRIPMSIVKNKLSVPVEDPVGEMPMVDVGEHAIRHIAIPEASVRNIQEVRDINPLQLIRRKETTAPADVFDRLISQPGMGVWKNTDESSAYLRSLN